MNAIARCADQPAGAIVDSILKAFATPGWRPGSVSRGYIVAENLNLSRHPVCQARRGSRNSTGVAGSCRRRWVVPSKYDRGYQLAAHDERATREKLRRTVAKANFSAMLRSGVPFQ